MSINTAITAIDSQDEFCLALKAARERTGITLADISNATKIPAYLFDALERNDLRRWPHGLFRRSFFRDYVQMIGLPVSDAVAAFVRLFPDDAAPGVAAAESPAQAADQPESSFSRLSATLSDAISGAFRKPSVPGDAEAQGDRAWVSDARRVGPSSGLRVRIKLPK